MFIFGIVFLLAVSLAVYWFYQNHRVSASGEDWLIVKSTTLEGSFFMLYFYPIIGWRFKKGVYMPELQNADQLKRFESGNKELHNIFYVRGGRVFNPYSNNHPLGSLEWFIDWVCSENKEEADRCWQRDVPATIRHIYRNVSFDPLQKPMADSQ